MLVSGRRILGDALEDILKGLEIFPRKPDLGLKLRKFGFLSLYSTLDVFSEAHAGEHIIGLERLANGVLD
jgi:hypothetical protein